MEQEGAVCLKGLTKRFGSVVANDKIDLELGRGEILALLGENGSGKTTLMNMISGIYFPDEGQIFVGGREVTIRSPKDAFDLGIGMIHQHYKLVDVFTAAENIVLGLPEKGKFDKRAIAQKVRQISERYGFDIDPDKKIYDMSVSEKQTVEIVKVLYRGADILILDEPLSGVDIEGERQLLDMLDEVRQQYDLSILLSTHDFATLEEYADKVILLQSSVLKSGPPREVLSSHEFRDVFHLSLGRGWSN